MLRQPIALLVLIACLAVGLGAPRAAADPPGDSDLGEAAGFLVLFPQLRALPAPIWFRPGARASYETAGAIIGGGGSGAGIVEYNVVALDAERAWVLAQGYGDNGGGALVPLGTANPLVGLPAVGEFWIHPSVLVNAETVANPNLSVVRLNRVVLGQAIVVVRFQSTTAGGEAVWEFDTTTGLLTFYRRSTTDPISGNSSLLQSNLLGLRALPLPWPAALAPNWARPGATMLYTGTQSTTIPTAGTTSLPLQLGAQITSATRTWSLLDTASFLNGVSIGGGPAVNGIGQFGAGFWLPREALTVNVPEPRVVDTDPVTGVQTSLARAQNGDLVVTQSAQAFQTISVYNRVLGSLDALQQTIISPTAMTQIQLFRTGGSDLESLDRLPELPDDPPAAGSNLFLPLISRDP
jgi:hypothetical protein